MARKHSASDEQIMQAALKVIIRQGHDGFTLSAVAAEVGLSRAAIILRFKGTEALKATLTAYIAGLFVKSLQALPTGPSGNNLLALVAHIGGMLTTPGSLAAFMRHYHTNLNNEELAQVEHQRGAALQAAISVRMPPVGISHESAVLAFNANLTGSMMQWEVRTDIDARSYLVERTKAWLTLARIPFDGELAGD
jgi:TetR/AcrR family transcriptional regulator, macrolide resistance operon repressor